MRKGENGKRRYVKTKRKGRKEKGRKEKGREE